jgi:hypothetical protein
VLPPALDGLRVEVELLGQRFEIRYRVRGAGAASTRCSSTAARWRSARRRIRIGAVPHESR